MKQHLPKTKQNTPGGWQRAIALMVIFGLFVSTTQAQMWEEMKRDNIRFDEIVKKVEEYYKDKDQGRGSGYKQFKRWEYENMSNVDENGNWISDNHFYEEFTRFKKAYKASQGKNFRASDPNAIVAGNSNWVELGPHSWTRTSSWSPGLGRIKDLAVNPKNHNEIYIVSPGGGCWKTTVGGNNWKPLTDHLPVFEFWSVAIDPVNTNNVYIGSAGGGIYKSTNAGASWTKMSTGLDANATINKIIVDPSNPSIVIAGTSSGVYRSTNGGSSWTRTYSGDVQDVEFKPGNSSIVYASTTKVYRSTNNGQSFSAVTGIVGSGRTMLAVTAANPNYVYALQANGSIFGYLYRSTDSGANFSVRVTGNTNGRNYFGYEPSGVDTRGQAWHDMAICVSPTNAEEVHIGGIITWKSTNGGSSFVATTEWSYPNSRGYTHCDMHDLEYIGNTLYTASDGGIFKSTDGGDNFMNLSTGLGIRQFYRIACARSNANMVTGGSQDNGSSIWKGSGWIDWLGADGMEGLIDHNNSNIVYGTSQYGTLYKSTNGGSSYSYLTKPTSESGNWVTPLAMDPVNPQIIYAGYDQIYRSTNGGSSWTKLTNVNIGKFDNIVVAPSNGNYIYASSGATLIRSTNGGSSWTTVTSSYGHIYSIAVHDSDPRKVAIASNSTNKVLVSTDAGASWSSMRKNLPNLPVRCIVYENGANEGLYVGMKPGIFYINKNLTEWVPFMDNLPNTEIMEMEIHYGSKKLRAATYGRGLWESPLYSTSSTNNAPVVSITSPTTNATFQAPANITINVNATDSDGSITKVEFFSGSTKLGEDVTAPYSFSWTNVAAGSYSITAKATDNKGLSTTSAEVKITVSAVVTQSPYGGTPWPIPGKIEAENYDLGGEGVAYHDIDPENIGGQYRMNEAVDIETCLDAGGGYSLGYIRPGEWVEYTVNVANTGTYKLDMRVASAVSGKRFRIEMNNVDITGLVTVPNTGDWQQWTTLTIDNVNLTKGVQIMKIVGIDEDVNINYVVFSSATCGVPNNLSVSNITESTATLKWNAQSGAVSYLVWWRPVGGSWTTNATVTGNSVNVTGLTSGIEYEFTVRSNCSGTSSAFASPYYKFTTGAANKAPVVSITSPSSGASFTAPANISITANASDSDGSIAKVEFYQGTTKIGEAVSAPYTFNWTNVAAGSYSLTAKATDNKGAATTSSAISITVNQATTCGVPNNLSVSNITTSTATLKWNAQSGAVSYLVWWRPVGGSWTTNATVTGNSVNVTGLTSGIEYEFTVRSNCSGTSSAFASPYYRFTTLAANKAPVVSITSPSNGASYTAPATVTITANASDSDGSIAKVEFFNGSTKIGEDATSPYSIQLTNLGAATYTITAKATDNQGASATSAAVTFTVNQVTTCSVPSNLSVANVTTNSATLKWSAQPGAERYLVWWRLAGTSWTTYAYTTTNSYSLTGLQSGKVYEFTVMTYCSGTSSEFSANYSFTTEAASACTGVAQYKENGGYTAGSKVQNANGVYQCRPWPNSGWCNGAAWAYAPGTGTYWQDAWVLVASCGTTPAAPTVNLPEPVVNPNPASGAKEIEVSYYSETDGNEELSVIPFSGKVVSSETIKVNRGENKIKVNISDLVDGIYLIKIGKHSVRFVKD